MKKLKKKAIKKTKLSDTKLTPAQELFCQCYAGHHDRDLFSNKTRSYIYSHGETDKHNELIAAKAANPSMETRAALKRFENLCAKLGSNLFRNVHIVDRVNELFDSLYSNDHVDRELSYTITQRYDLASKVQAIREFNRISNRIKKNESSDTVTFTWETGDSSNKEAPMGSTVTLPVPKDYKNIKSVTVTRNKAEDDDYWEMEKDD